MLNAHRLDVTTGARSTPVHVIGNDGAPLVILFHGGVPGRSFFMHGAHLWGKCLDHLAADRRLAVVDLPHSTSTAWTERDFTTESLAEIVLATIAQLGADTAHFVGHDSGGLVGMQIALTAPDKLLSLSIVASPMTAPSGDVLSNVTFTAAPLPKLSLVSQQWALDRISFSHFHLDAALLDACLKAAHGPQQRAVEDLGAERVATVMAKSMRTTQFNQWQAAREMGLGVPVQVIWGENDILTDRDAGYALFSKLAERQPAAQFHIVNRAGSLLFRDQPETFAQLVSAFQDGVMAERQR